MKPLLETREVTMGFGGRRALERVSIELLPGTTTVLLGPNGAGKSTLLRLALGLLKPHQGHVRVEGMDPVRSASEVHRMTGYVPDRPDVPGWMTPRELFGFLAPQYPHWDAEMAERLTARFSLSLDTPFAGLSRGRGMKAMLVAALAQRPRLLLMDEPFSGLDPVARNEIARGFLQEVDMNEGGALIATHDLHVAARLADRLVVLDEGRVVCEGSVEEVLEREGSSSRIPEGLYGLLERTRQQGAAA